VENSAFSTKRKTTSILLTQCVNKTGGVRCKTKAEIDHVMRGARVKFFIIENIWQASLSYPVLSFFNDGLKDGIIPSVHKQVTIDLSQN
jgi:hypothetical protein